MLSDLSVYYTLKSLKLVSECKISKFNEQLLLKEYLTYKIFNLLTDISFRVRLLNLTLQDSSGKNKPITEYAFLLEDVKELAKRNNCAEWKGGKRNTEATQRKQMTMVAIFEYMIGNTDWSVQYLQNIRLISADSNSVPITVPYDFDMSGIVNSPYATPAEELIMTSVRERRYRGYCVQDMKIFDKAIELYNSRKKDIYSIFTNCPLLDEKYIKSTIKFLDEFYATINNTNAVKKEFGYPCDKNGTGNVVIKGLKEESPTD